MNTYLWGLLLSLLLSQAVAERLGVKIYRQGKRLLLSMIPVSILFLLWDVVAIVRGHWFFGNDMLPVRILGLLPVEEVLFFIIIPYCSINTYECFREIRRRGMLA